mmetsp:Transcript_94758/g.173684  ORF Transcript_94758/g.173684 Transcript_94758/m.173684 type:complete len:582 (-) Transcript_94758:324-2069(-)
MTSLEAPLVDSNGGSAKWRRSVVKVAVVTTGCVAIAVAGFYFMVQSPQAEKKMMQAPLTVPEALELHPRLDNIGQVNELFKRLPAHDMEDAVYKHIQPHAKKLFHSFLQYHGSSAPHFKTGERLKRRYKLEDKEEFIYRQGIFEGILRDIIRLNNFEAHHSTHPNRAVFAVTKFSDWTWDEFQTLLKGPGARLNTTVPPKILQDKSKSSAAWGRRRTRGTPPPCSKNWAAEAPDVFKPRNQQSCGSCYAHAAAEEMRALTYINTGVDPGELSVQYILDCHGRGCRGGDAGNVMNWINDKGGIPTKLEYGPYTNKEEDCKSGVPYAATTTGAKRYSEEEDTANKLCSDGPLSMGVHVNDAFQSYYSGVLSAAACPAVAANHDTQVVAVLEEQGAWIIRNSWGSDWGVSASTFEPGSDAGFILLEYGKDTCHVTDGCSFPEGVVCVGASCSGETTAAPAPPPASKPAGTYCTNTCKYHDDHECDDGGDGGTQYCPLGTDCDDCGRRPSNVICENTCKYASDGGCDDGGAGSTYSLCAYGSDCDDCGPRQPESTCNDSCRYSNDGECDEPKYCKVGTDCSDCQR